MSTWLQNTSRKRKRGQGSSDNSTALPPPISIAPTQQFNGNDGMWSTFPMRIGRPAQDVMLLPSTAASTTWVSDASTGCPDGVPVPPATGNPDCFDSRGRLFDSDESATWIANSNYTLGVEGNLGLDSASVYGYDDVQIGTAGSNGPTADHQVIASNADPRYWVGALALNPQPTNFTDFVSPQPSLMETLKTTKQIPSISYGYSAGAYYRDSHVLGTLALGGYDAGQVIANDVSIPQGDDTSRDLLASVQGIKTNATADSLLPSGAIYSFVDSTIPHLYLPVDSCQAFEKAFGLVWDPTWELYLVNDSQHDSLMQTNPTITFTIGSQKSGGPTVDIDFPYAAFDMNVSFPFINSTLPPYLSTSRYFPLKQAANDTQYTLGRTFLQEAYLIADYEHKNFSLSSRNFSEGTQSSLQPIYPAGYQPPESDSSSSLSSGAIAGIVIAILAVMAVIVAMFIFIRRYNQMKRRARQTIPSPPPSSRGGFTHSGEYYPMDRKSGTIETPPRHLSRNLSEKDSGTRYEMAVPGKYGGGYGHKKTGSQEIVGTEVPRELHADGTSGATWEADSSMRFELPGSDAPIGMSEKLGGARLSGREESNSSQRRSARDERNSSHSQVSSQISGPSLTRLSDSSSLMQTPRSPRFDT